MEWKRRVCAVPVHCVDSLPAGATVHVVEQKDTGSLKEEVDEGKREDERVSTARPKTS